MAVGICTRFLEPQPVGSTKKYDRKRVKRNSW